MERAEPSLSDHAYAKMWDLYQHHDHEVGSNYTGEDGKGKTVTDCITYVQNVLRHAYAAAGERETSRRINFAKGTDLAAYLVTLGWKACYWNPDVRQPRDGLPEHPFSYQQAVKTGKYYDVKVKSFAVNYNRQSPTPKEPNNYRVYRKLQRLKFAYGIAKGGYHTFLFSSGYVFEVHWAAIGDGLYERRSLYTYGYLSGVLLIPPDLSFVGDPR